MSALDNVYGEVTRKNFAVTFYDRGHQNSPMTIVAGRPAYCKNGVNKFPQVGETWIVETDYVGTRFIILRPVRKVENEDEKAEA